VVVVVVVVFMVFIMGVDVSQVKRFIQQLQSFFGSRFRLSWWAEQRNWQMPEKCANCGNTHLQPAGTCMICLTCGETTGCS
jgi:hypothetical protein